MNKIPPQLQLIFEIENEGAQLIRKSCLASLSFAKDLAPGVTPSPREWQEAYRFLAARVR